MNLTVNGFDRDCEDISQGRARGPLVCIVEGRSGIARTALQYLRRGDFRVRMFPASAFEVKDLLREEPALIIIEMEVATPCSRGLHFCRAIRRAATSELPILLIAQNSSEEDRIFGLESGADDFITQAIPALRRPKVDCANLRRKKEMKAVASGEAFV